MLEKKWSRLGEDPFEASFLFFSFFLLFHVFHISFLFDQFCFISVFLFFVKNVFLLLSFSKNIPRLAFV